jgi:hypothetical protein
MDFNGNRSGEPSAGETISPRYFASLSRKNKIVIDFERKNSAI